MSPRRWFHVLLGAVFLPVVSLPLVWGVGIRSLRRAADADSRRWARRILALAAVDTVVVIVGGLLLAYGVQDPEVMSAPAQDPVAIGVMPDHAFRGPGVRVERLIEGGPAAAAGVQVGDVIVRVAGEEISGPEALRRVVRDREPGVTVAIEVTRGSSTSVVPVTPERSSRLRSASGPSAPRRARSCLLRPRAVELVPLVSVLAALAMLGALVARRAASGAARAVWWTGLSLVSASIASYAAFAGACLVVGGQDPIASTSLVWGSSLALAGTALAGRGLAPTPPVGPPARSWRSAVRTGLWYLVTGEMRLAVLLLGAMQLARGHELSFDPLETLGEELGSAHGTGMLLLAIPVVIVGPVGEELAFRGLLQPALGTWLRPAAAVAVTSLLFASMHFYYGPRMVLVLLLAVVVGWARIASGGLRAPIVLHMLVNAVGFVPIALQALGQG